MLLRWKIPRKFHPSGYITCLVTRRRMTLLLFVLVFLWLFRKGGVVCLHSEMGTTLSMVCEQFNKGDALGDMCNEICEVGTLEPVQCQTGHSGKEVVFEATFRDIEVFVKARTMDLESESEGSVFWTEDEKLQFPNLEQFTMMIDTHLKMNLNLSIQDSNLFKLWPILLHKESYSPRQNKLLLENSMKNIWTLALDNEYVFLRLFKHYDVFPEIFGSCGGLYVVEKVRPLDMPYYLQRVSFQGWVERVKLAIAILDLLEELENMFDHPVHLCDIKSEHFGLSDHGRAKFLDVDNVYLKPIVDRTVGDGTKCQTHSDCDLFDCRGRCDLINRKCTGEVINNNLQVVCEKIFLGDNLGFRFAGGTGLLASRHASRGLKQALQRCANPTGSKDGVRLSADQTMFTKLYASLKEVVTIDNMINR